MSIRSPNFGILVYNIERYSEKGTFRNHDMGILGTWQRFFERNTDRFRSLR